MESNLKIQQGANDGWFIYKDNRLLLGSHYKELIEKIKVLLDEAEIEKMAYKSMADKNGHVVCEYCNEDAKHT